MRTFWPSERNWTHRLTFSPCHSLQRKQEQNLTIPPWSQTWQDILVTQRLMKGSHSFARYGIYCRSQKLSQLERWQTCGCVSRPGRGEKHCPIAVFFKLNCVWKYFQKQTFFCMVTAGSGSGKSRICEEMKVWCAEFVKQNPIVSVVFCAVALTNT